jgi:uncharacterized damage-inducible protein DinB
MLLLTPVPHATVHLLQHALDTYQSETNKTSAVWAGFTDADLCWRPADRSMTVIEVMKHHFLSERRFFEAFLGSNEPPASEVIPPESTVEAFRRRMVELAAPRLPHLALQPEPWWLEAVPFFDVERERVWILWRRILHSAHHRTQLTVCLRLLAKPVPSVYGPTADLTWSGATPTVNPTVGNR